MTKFFFRHWAAEEATRLACFLSSQRCWKYTVRTTAISTAMVVWLLHASEQTAPSLPMLLTLRVASLMTRLRIRSDGSRDRGLYLVVASCICVIPCGKLANIANYSVTSQCVVVKVQIRVYSCTAGCYHGVCSRRLSLVVLTNAKLLQRSHWPFKRSQVSHVLNKSPVPPFTSLRSPSCFRY